MQRTRPNELRAFLVSEYETTRDETRTPWSVEFMKQVLPWLMSPGGRLASRSSSSRRFFSEYISCGVCLCFDLIMIVRAWR